MKHRIAPEAPRQGRAPEPTSAPDATVARELDALVAEYALSRDQGVALARLLAILAEDPAAPTAVTAPRDVAAIHLADSLSALVLSEVSAAERVADLGSGAGLPGLPLAIALPRASVALVESNARKCAFLEQAIAAVGVSNAFVAHVRAEAWPAGSGEHDLVTARAVGPLSVLCEYAAPLLRRGGTLVAWKAALTAAESQAGARAAELLGLELVRQVRTTPYPQSERHQLVVFRKVSDTPDRFPRRPGVARKRPLGAQDR